MLEKICKMSGGNNKGTLILNMTGLLSSWGSSRPTSRRDNVSSGLDFWGQWQILSSYTSKSKVHRKIKM